VGADHTVVVATADPTAAGDDIAVSRRGGLVEGDDRQTLEKGVGSGAPQRGLGGIGIESALQFDQAEDGEDHLAVVLEQFVQHAVVSVAGMDGDVGVEQKRQGLQAGPFGKFDDVANLESILGTDEGKALWYGSMDGKSMSLDSALNAIVNKLGSLNKHALIAVDQAAGTIKLAQYASDAAQTTAANSARSSAPASPAVFVTHSVPVPTVSAPSAGPNFGL